MPFIRPAGELLRGSLLAHGLIAPEELDGAEREARRFGVAPGAVLLSRGMVAQADYFDRLSMATGIPRLGLDALRTAMAALGAEEAEAAARSGMVPLWPSGQGAGHAAAIADPGAVRAAGGDVCALVTPDELRWAVQAEHGAAFAARASGWLAGEAPALSAHRRTTVAQRAAMAAMGLAGLAGLLVAPAVTAIAANILCAFFFLAVSALRLTVLVCRRGTLPPDPPLPDDRALPVYTILVPLFREAAILPHLAAALRALDYPPEKLDIKILLEEDDTDSRHAAAALDLPPWFECLVVPRGEPQTKPRALNYGLRFARGEFVVIYDAEDAPEPDQLRKAVAAFRAAPRDVACFQARLSFYNPDENWLTRQFTVEYASLFDLMLPVMADLDLPVPLGGTSNHFRADTLREVRAWDPWNVTEDADLGLRLARSGWRVGMLASTTYEEANCRLGNWIRQRSRWIKGWMQTWLVHMRSPVRLWRDLGAAGFFATQALVGGIVVSGLVHPLFLAVIAADALGGVLFAGVDRSWLAATLAASSILVLVTGYGCVLAAGYAALGEREGLRRLRRAVPAMPLYWLLVSLGAWHALWQFIRKPFYWEKTEHAVSAQFHGTHED